MRKKLSVEETLALEMANMLAIDELSDEDLQAASELMDETLETGERPDPDRLYAELLRLLQSQATTIASTLLDAATYMKDEY